MHYNFIKGQFTEAQLEEAIKTLFTDKEMGNGFLYSHGESLHCIFDEIILEDELRAILSGTICWRWLDDGEKRLYFVMETKGTIIVRELKGVENFKI